MNIIFGSNIDLIPDSFTVLELDTFATDQAGATAWAVLDQVSLQDLATLESHKNLHQIMWDQYRARDWGQCLNTVEQLLGKWSGQLDSFYLTMQQRLHRLASDPPGDEWDGTVSVDQN
jgi:hypothetical protein